MKLKTIKISVIGFSLVLCFLLGSTSQLFSNSDSQDYTYLCGDLLAMYAQKPDKLEFIECKVGSHAQTLVEATYEVSGENSKTVEDFFVQKYGMGKLVWVCCGYESRGQYGEFSHERLEAVSPYVSGIITMAGSGEIENSPQGVGLEFDRNKIRFIVTVTILEV